jgi:exodeoxyribonuclease-3
VPAALCDIEGYWCYWHGSKGYSGVALHVSKLLSAGRPAFSHPEFNYENRIVAVDLETDIGALTIASVYVPNGGKDFPAKMLFLTAMDEYATSFQSTGRPLVLCGDMNVARTEMDVHPKERKPRAIGQLPEERALIDRILSRGLVDVGRALDPDNAGLFTWWAPWRNMRQRNIGWRLDYVFANVSLAARARACVVQKEVGTSDHAPVVAIFDSPTTYREATQSNSSFLS